MMMIFFENQMYGRVATRHYVTHENRMNGRVATRPFILIPKSC